MQHTWHHRRIVQLVFLQYDNEACTNVSSLAGYSTVRSDHLRDNQNSARYTFNVYANTVEFVCI